MRRRNKVYQEQNLARAAAAAGVSFGWTDSEASTSRNADLAMRRRVIGLYLPALFLTPFATSLAYYFGG